MKSNQDYLDEMCFVDKEGKPIRYDSQWVECSKRMPTTTDDVLVVNEDGRMAVSCYFRYADIWMWERRDDVNGLGNITHWMPLPEPPKEIS